LFRARFSLVTKMRALNTFKCASKMGSRLEKLLTSRETAEFLGLPESTLSQWRSQRRGPPYIKLESRLVRYRRSDLEAYIGQHLVGTEVDKTHA